jgi:hypothetical protein
MPDRIDFFIRRLKLFLFNDIFSVLFYVSIPDFKVRDMVLTVMNHILDVKEKVLKILEKVFFNFLLILLFRR